MTIQPRHVIAVLLAGAVVNVGVAWGCALWSEIKAGPENATTFNHIRSPKSLSDDIPPDFEYGIWSAGHGVSIREGLGTKQLIHVRSISAGWPKRSLIGSRVNRRTFVAALPPPPWITSFDAANTSRFIPLRPLWPGFAINTLFYAGLMCGLIVAPLVVRRWRRVKRGLCPTCAYDLRGTNVGLCPECGARI